MERSNEKLRRHVNFQFTPNMLPTISLRRIQNPAANVPSLELRIVAVDIYFRAFVGKTISVREEKI